MSRFHSKVLSFAIFCCVALASLSGCEDAKKTERTYETKLADLTKKFEAKHRALIERCNSIATERVILASNYNAMLVVYKLNYKPEVVTDNSCSEDEISSSGATKPAEGATIDAKSRIDDSASRQLAAEALTVKRSAPQSLCWEGYCPCDPPQGGPDQLLCDQVRFGKADPEQLSVGKSMREVRRQIEAHPF